jgi:hypothetical protein
MSDRPIPTPRSEAQIITRAPEPIILAGQVFKVRPAVASKSKLWKEAVGAAFNESWAEIQNLKDLNALIGLAYKIGTETLAELVVSYDQDNVLPPASWVIDNASDIEIYEAFKAEMGLAFPFLRDAAKMGTGTIMAALGSLSSQLQATK